MKYGSKEYNSILKGFRSGSNMLNDVEIDIKGDVNTLPPLVLLRAYEEEPTIDNLHSLASQFVMNKTVVFTYKERTLLEFTYNGGNLGDHFVETPYLLDLLLKLCYSIMIKKLTPPSEDSEKEDKRSE